MQFIEYLGRKVGLLRDDGTFISKRREEHIFRFYGGLGVSFDVLKRLQKLHCRKIVLLLERETGVVEKYVTTPEHFLEEGFVYMDGLDSQRILSFRQLENPPLTQWVRKQ